MCAVVGFASSSSTLAFTIILCCTSFMLLINKLCVGIILVTHSTCE